jgi:hypothetical protein
MSEEDNLPIKIHVKADSKDAAKVINKIIDTVKAPFSWWAKSKEPILQAKADVEATLIRARAIEPLVETLGISKEDAVSLVLRADQREQFDRVRQQRNLENVVQGAIELAPRAVNDQPVDEDWTSEFLGCCKNIRDKDMQALWARILAGEVSTPGKYSKRTLNYLKTMDKKEAEAFTAFCSFAFSDINGWRFIFQDEFTISLVRETFCEDYQGHFTATGLLSPTLKGMYASKNDGRTFNYFDRRFIGSQAEIKHAHVETAIPFFVFTQIGQQLAEIAGSTPIQGYVEGVFRQLNSACGFNVIEAQST